MPNKKRVLAMPVSNVEVTPSGQTSAPAVPTTTPETGNTGQSGTGDTGTSAGINSVVAAAKSFYDTWYGYNYNARAYFNKRFYGYEASQPWCAIFTWCCYEEAGLSSYTDKSAMASGMTCDNSKGTWHTWGSDYYKPAWAPKPGAIVAFDWDIERLGRTAHTDRGTSEGYSHVGIVISWDATTNTLTTIEGNVGPTDSNGYYGVNQKTNSPGGYNFNCITGFWYNDSVPIGANSNLKTSSMTDNIKAAVG